MVLVVLFKLRGYPDYIFLVFLKGNDQYGAYVNISFAFFSPLAKMECNRGKQVGSSEVWYVSFLLLWQTNQVRTIVGATHNRKTELLSLDEAYDFVKQNLMCHI